MFYHAKSETLSLGTTSMDYVVFGSGTRPLIMIPGLNVRGVRGAGISLAFMYRMFAKRYRVYVFDRKEEIPEGYTVRDIAADTAEAMRLLGISNADVFGVSQGGMIALELTLEHPERVDRLVLGVTASRANENIKRVVGNWVNCAHKKDHVTINKETFSLMYTEKYLKRYKLLMPLLVRMIKPRDFERFAVLASAILDFDCYDRLPEIKCPVLVLGGEQDKITTGEASVEIAQKLNCEIHMYPEYGHAAYEEAKDFNEKVHDFLLR